MIDQRDASRKQDDPLVLEKEEAGASAMEAEPNVHPGPFIWPKCPSNRLRILISH